MKLLVPTFVVAMALALLPEAGARHKDRDRDRDRDHHHDRDHRHHDHHRHGDRHHHGSHHPRIGISFGSPYYGSSFYGSRYGYGYPYDWDYPYSSRYAYYDDYPYVYRSYRSYPRYRTYRTTSRVYRGRSATSSSRSLFVAVQAELAKRGFYRGPIDGDVGPMTRAAIRSYQRSRGLTVTGVVDTKTVRSLGIG